MSYFGAPLRGSQRYRRWNDFGYLAGAQVLLQAVRQIAKIR
ncbi:MAG: hypothetical protein QNJ54_32850 [Prochloraceae cyanobacterium]|nr:hypothetical protein [Prochloraceae cyanobacterium]